MSTAQQILGGGGPLIGHRSTFITTHLVLLSTWHWKILNCQLNQSRYVVTVVYISRLHTNYVQNCVISITYTKNVGRGRKTVCTDRNLTAKKTNCETIED